MKKRSSHRHTVSSRTWKRAALGSAVVACCLLTVSMLAAVQQQDFVIVVSGQNSVDTLTRARVDGMFLGKVKAWPDGVEVAPALNADADLCESFAQAIHSRSYAAVSAYWAAKTFRDFVAPPPKLKDAEVITFTKSNPGAIGFVHKGASLAGVKLLKVTD